VEVAPRELDSQYFDEIALPADAEVREPPRAALLRRRSRLPCSQSG